MLGEIPDAGFPLVHVDDRRIAQLAVEHLRRQGFRHFAFLGLKGLPWSEARGHAFRELAAGPAGRAHVLELPPYGLLQVDWEALEGRLAEWVAALPKPVGVMLCSDQLGPAFFEGCRRARAVAPGEVAVIGVDDDRPLCEVCDPPLSSIRAGHEQVGYAAAARLAEILEGHSVPDEPLWIEPEGVVSRLSTEVLAVEDRQVAEALRFIREHGCRKLDLDTVARQVGLSRSVLQRRFRSTLGRTVHEEILALRLDRACGLLADSDLPIADIAERCGFTHQEYLGVVFKARMRVTPATYRRTFGTGRAPVSRRRALPRSRGLG